MYHLKEAILKRKPHQNFHYIMFYLYNHMYSFRVNPEVYQEPPKFILSAIVGSLSSPSVLLCCPAPRALPALITPSINALWLSVIPATTPLKAALSAPASSKSLALVSG